MMMVAVLVVLPMAAEAAAAGKGGNPSRTFLPFHPSSPFPLLVLTHSPHHNHPQPPISGLVTLTHYHADTGPLGPTISHAYT